MRCSQLPKRWRAKKDEIAVRRFDPAQLDIAAQRLGEVVLDPGQWPSVLEEMSAAVGATGAVLLQSDVRTSDVPITPSIGELAERYFKDGWHEHDVRADRGVPLILGGKLVIGDDDIMSREDLRTNVTYNEHFIPLGFPWFTAVGFWSGPALWGLSFQRTASDGLLTSNEKGELVSLSRKLTEAATLSQLVGRAMLSSATNALDGIQKAAVAVDRTGRVLETNSAAQALFDNSFNLRSGRLWVIDSHAQAQLAALMERIKVNSDLDVLPVDPIVVRRKLRPPVVIQVLPVHGGARSPFLGARVILTLTPVTARPSPGEVLLSRVFNLTAAEARLASVLTQGMSVAEAARRLGVSRLTVRTQLKAVFAKTGTHRQAELVALLTSL